MSVVACHSIYTYDWYGHLRETGGVLTKIGPGPGRRDAAKRPVLVGVGPPRASVQE